MTRSALAAVGACTIALLLIIAAGSASALAGPGAPPPLTSAELDRYWITSATDVTSSEPAASQAAAISKEKAIGLAQDEIGTTDDNVRVLFGQAAQYPGQTESAVWIVLFNGGVAPFDGPDGAPPVTYTVTGVLIDATTGDFLRGFMQ